MTAASGADRCTCGHSVASHDGWGQGACAAARCSCETFTDPGADQPTLRDQLAEAVPHAYWCHERDRELGGPCVCDHYRLNTADALLPLIEADRERAKAEGGAEALEKARWAVHVLRFNADDDPEHRWPPGSPKAVPTYYAGVIRAERELRERTEALRGSTGGGT